MVRPLIGKEKRKPLMALVDPETIARLDEYAAAKGVSRGIAIDHAAKKLKPKRPSPP